MTEKKKYRSGSIPAAATDRSATADESPIELELHPQLPDEISCQAFYQEGSDLISGKTRSSSSADLKQAARHWHSWLEILYVVQGTTRAECDHTEYLLTSGDLILFQPGAVHAVYRPSRNARYGVIRLNISDLAEFRIPGNEGSHPAAVIRSAWKNPHAPIFLPQKELAAYPVSILVRQCIQELEDPQYGYSAVFYSASLTLLTVIIRVWIHSHGFQLQSGPALAPALTGSSADSSTILSITSYIEEHACQKSLLVENLAERCGMSYSYFAKKFRQIYQMSCKDYIFHIRILKAKNLLQYTELNLNEISQETGFSDCSHFVRVFHHLEGITPRQFRMQSLKTRQHQET